MVGVAEALAAKGQAVLEIGPGQKPLRAATVFVDWQAWPQLAGRPLHVLDLNQEPLPFADKSFDFVYCRHTLEDLYNPFWVCREMSRVGKAGYVETPSPLAECGRGVDGGSPAWRGYHHHRYLIWVEHETLMLAPKYPILEHLSFGETEAQIVSILNSHPLFWNTYYFWEGVLCYRLLEHDKDYRIAVDYGKKIVQATHQSYEHTKRIAARYLAGEIPDSVR
jgi:hypothetical protein